MEATTRRIDGLDVLRTVAILAVVVIHTPHSDTALPGLRHSLTFAVPVLTMIAAYLSLYSLARLQSRKTFLRRRLERLVPAFLAWTGIYVTIRLIAGSIYPLSTPKVLGYLFLGASSLHLYFIPLIIYYTIGATALPTARALRMLICVGCLLGALALNHLGSPRLNLGSPEADAFPYYFISNLPYLFLGLLLFDLVESRGTGSFLDRNSGIAFLLCALAVPLLWLSGLPSANPVARLACYGFLFLAFRFWSFGTNRFFSVISGMSYGIYLSHHLFLEGVGRIEMLFLDTTDAPTATLVRFGVGLLVTTLFCLLASRRKQTAWLVA
jgi:peptidoglycan/LPS O-acetylase OafA/YrhL